MAKVHIEVTQDDIDHGYMKHQTACPIYFAARRQIKRALFVRSTYMLLINGDVVDLPDEVHEFISRFDEGRYVAPFAFDLEIPDEVLS